MLDLKSWMTGFALTHEAGEVNQVGEVLRLYEGQDFFIQTTGKVEGETLVLSNLPSQFSNESSTGTAVLNLHTDATGSKVVLTMVRRYVYLGEGDNPMKARRSSDEFKIQSRTMWTNFLQTLKRLSES